MTFEEHVKKTNDINKLKDELIEYNLFFLSFEAFLIEKLGKEKYIKLSKEYASFRAKTLLKELLEVNEA